MTFSITKPDPEDIAGRTNVSRSLKPGLADTGPFVFTAVNKAVPCKTLSVFTWDQASQCSDLWQDIYRLGYDKLDRSGDSQGGV